MAENVLNAIQIALNSASKPLHVDDITKFILDNGLWKTSGQTPKATVAARLYSDIKMHGENSRFLKVAPKTFGLRKFSKESSSEDESTSNYAEVTDTGGSTSQGFPYLECAQMVLEKFGDGKPMHYRKITRLAIEEGWLQTEGKTPEYSMNSIINSEIRSEQNRGKLPRFINEKGNISLRQWDKHSFASEIFQHNEKVTKEYHEKLLNMDPYEFENLVSDLLTAMGFEETEVTPPSNDKGVDVRGELIVSDVIRVNMAVQVKRWKNNVGVNEIRNLRGSLEVHEQGLLVTTSDFSNDAKQDANDSTKQPINLMNGTMLLALLMRHQIGVEQFKPELYDFN